MGQAVGDGAGQGVEALGAGGGFAQAGDGFAGVAADADARVNFDFAEHGYAVSDGGFRAFAVAENINGLVAMRAAEGTHIFDDAEDFHVDLAKHFNGFANVGESDGGRSRDDDGASDGDGLDERELHVACARRKVNEQVIEFAPFDAAKKLRDDAVEHWPAPNHRLVAGIQQTHGDHFHACNLHGNNALFGGGLRLLQRAEHDGNVGAVDVSVHEADFEAELNESEGEVDGHRGFADAAFAAGDRDEIFYAWDGMAFGLRLGCWTGRHEITLSRI